MERAIFSALHLLGLAVALGAVFARGRALRRGQVDAILYADNWWGISALVLLGTGLVRLFLLEKGTGYYFGSQAFLAKMALFGTVLALEVWPMVTLMRWRIGRMRGREPDLSRTPMLARVNDLETALVVVIPFLAAGMARGF